MDVLNEINIWCKTNSIDVTFITVVATHTKYPAVAIIRARDGGYLVHAAGENILRACVDNTFAQEGIKYLTGRILHRYYLPIESLGKFMKEEIVIEQQIPKYINTNLNQPNHE